MTYETVIIKPVEELITVDEAKVFMNIGFNDFDALLSMLIKSAILQGEKNTGLRFNKVKVKVKGYGDMKPVKPVFSFPDTIGEEYEYIAGYSAETFPEDLKVAVLMSVATGFAYRQNSVEEAVTETINASIYTFRSYISNPMF